MPTDTPDDRSDRSRLRGLSPDERTRETASTALFTGVNIAVFLILAASVVGAAVIYSQGA